MGKQSKATKKFERKHLKDTIDRRKDFSKIKQRHQKKDKKKQRSADKAKRDESSGEEEDVPAEDDMNQDKYFQEKVTIPEANAKLNGKAATGKRKREAEVQDTHSLNGDLQASNDGSDEEDEMDMAALAEKDPEFHKFLKENDPELLDFNEDDDLEGLELSEDEDEDDRPSKKRRTGEDEHEPTTVTLQLVKKWKKSMTESQSIRALREVVLAFRAAAHMHDIEAKEYKYTIPSGEVYHEVLITALKEAPKVLSHHLPVKESASGKIKVPTESAQFKKLSPLVRTYATSINHLLAGLSDAPTLRLTLQSFEPLLPYLLQFRKFLKLIVKSVAGIWSDNTSDEATRITAFLILRRLLAIGDAGIKETVLKSAYEQLIKGSRNTTAHTIAGINLMKNSAAELWGPIGSNDKDSKIAYTTAFSFIRSAAIHLRTNITKPSKDSYKSIYNWQFVHSLDFWSRVLSVHCNSLTEAEQGSQSPLRPLIYPVVQVTLGVMRLIPTSTYFPLRFHLMRALLRISQSTGTYIPLASGILEVLNSPELKKPSKNASLRPLDFSINIRAPASYLKTRVYQDGLGEQVVDILSEFLVLWCKNIAYPELQLPMMVLLKRWLKSASKASTGNKNGKVNQALLVLVQKSEANAKWVRDKRDREVTYTPRDRAQVETFAKEVQWEDTPIGAFVVGQRKLREERAKVVAQGREDEQKRRRKQKEGEESDDEVGIEVEA